MHPHFNNLFIFFIYIEIDMFFLKQGFNHLNREKMLFLGIGN